MYMPGDQHVHMSAITLTELRKDLFRLMDRVLETGEPLLIRRGGRVLRVTAETAPAGERPLTPAERYDQYMAEGPREGFPDLSFEEIENAGHWTWDPDAIDAEP